MTDQARVAIIGSINIDLAATCKNLPAPGQTLIAESFERSPGGKGGNQAVAAARATVSRVMMIGAVGEDEVGDQLVQALEDDGVDTSLVRKVPGQPSGTALITVDEHGENTIVVAAGANSYLDVDDAVTERMRTADVVLAQLEVPQAAVVAAASARRPGTPFVLNAAPAAPLEDALAREIDILVVNEGEARGITGIDDLDQAVDALLALVPSVLVTMGAAGSRFVRRGEQAFTVPAPVVTAVDTVAAGDTFCGVFAARLASGDDEMLAMQTATAAAALTVQRVGAQVSIPTAADVESSMETAHG